MSKIFQHFFQACMHGDLSHKLLINTLMALKQDNFDQIFITWLMIFTIVDVILLVINVHIHRKHIVTRQHFIIK